MNVDVIRLRLTLHTMTCGYHYRCLHCDHCWDRARIVVQVGPSEMVKKHSLKCHDCQFSIVSIAEIDRVSWRSWKQSHSEMLKNSKTIRNIAKQIERQLRWKLYSHAKIKLSNVTCHFCGSAMDESPKDYQCPRCPECSSQLTTAAGMFVDSITCFDPEDHSRWWLNSR